MGWEVGDLKRTRFANSIMNTVEAVKNIKKAALTPEEFLKLPQFVSGARVYLMVGGQLIGLATSFQWSVNSSVEPILTVDSDIAWEVVPNSFSIRASISQIIDPDESAESQGLWATMRSSQHQPNMEISVFDKLGTNLVNIRGMPTQITHNIQAGQVATRNVSFVGYMFTHNVSQGFEPYDDAGFVKAMRRTAQNISSTTGGFI